MPCRFSIPGSNLLLHPMEITSSVSRWYPHVGRDIGGVDSHGALAKMGPVVGKKNDTKRHETGRFFDSNNKNIDLFPRKKYPFRT